MTEANVHLQDRLMARLVDDLVPVRRVGPPWRSALAWISLSVAIGLVLAWFADMASVEHRLMAVPDMWLAVLGSTLTAVLAAIATFELGRPDRSFLWAALPLPGLAIWIGASGMGCARTWLLPGTSDATMAETGYCLMFIVGLSVPLSVAMLLFLRRGYSLYPTLMGAVGGLAAAAAAATLLNFFHSFDAALDDLLVHAFAVTLVVLANRALGGRLFRGRVKARAA